MSKKLILIFALGLFLRLFQISTLPSGFHIDEVKLGWNAYSLLKTGRDDWMHAFPLYYDTFGDQRPTGLFYASVPALTVFKLTEFAVRFTPALFGSLGIFAIFYLVLAITNKRMPPLLSALMLSISPWHITLSRSTSEGIVATTLTLFGLYFLVISFSKRKTKPLILAFIFLSLSYFFYHTFRLIVPIFSFGLAAYYYRGKLFLPSIIMTLLFGLLTLTFVYNPNSTSRLSQVSIFADTAIKDSIDRLPFEEGDNHILIARIFHNKAVIYSTKFINEYSSYFTGKFFFTFGEAKPARYQTVMRGPVLYIEAILVILGLIAIAQKKLSPLPILFLLISPLATAITTEDAPNLHRALMMAPFISILAGFGLDLISKHSRRLLFITLTLLSFDFIYFAHMYMVHNSQRDSIAIMRNSGEKELINEIVKLSPKYQKILLSIRPDQHYPFYAFYTKQNPEIFNPQLAINKQNDWQYKNFVFTQTFCPSQTITNIKTLAVDAEGCPPPLATENLKVIKSINRSTSVPAFYLITTN